MEAAAPALIDDRYRPVQVLGQGSFARTLACQDLADGQRLVALKELRVQGIGDWKPVELFEREARVLEGLRHQAVPAIFRHFEGRNDTGQLCLYLVMELVDGRSLAEELRSGRRLSDVELTELALALLDVLEYLHARLPPVFHRDIKPSNIVRRANGAPVLVDFGAVGQGWRPPQGGSTVTGTFGYMAPEQLLGQVSAASDLYALGATLLHLATGREPTDFSYDSGRLSLPPEVPLRPALRGLIDGLLSPAPRDRPPSAAAARRQLLAEPGPTQARPAAALIHLPVTVGTLTATPAGGRPEQVEVGLPPRDPAGPLADVYANLIEVFDGRRVSGPRKRGWHAVGRATLGTLAFVGSLGLWPGYRGWLYRRRRRVFEPLFRNGTATVGRLLSVTGGDADFYATLTYEFEAGGLRYRDNMHTSMHVVPHWLAGDPVTVLHDPGDPKLSCVVYRWRL